jgi:hypothetical protein
VAGDQILFEGGSTFSCSDSTYMYLQADKTKGTAASPVKIGSYGTGRATIQANSSHGLMVWVPESGTVGVGVVVTNLVTDLFSTKIVESLSARSPVTTYTDTVNRAGSVFYRVQMEP